MGVPDRVCRECRIKHYGCPANSVETCIEAKPTCSTCRHKAPGRFIGMAGSPGIPESIRWYGCELLAPYVGIQDGTKACKHYERVTLTAL